MNLVELAQRIKTKRLERRMTLAELAKASGQTYSWLSKVENFRVTPSLPALARLSAALGMSTSEILAGLDAMPDICIVPVNKRKKVERDRPRSSIVYESLAFPRASRVMDPFVLTIPKGVARKEAMAHEGEEFLMVITGSIKFDYGNETHLMKQGDAAYFDASVKHRVVNPGTKGAKILCVFCNQVADR